MSNNADYDEIKQHIHQWLHQHYPNVACPGKHKKVALTVCIRKMIIMLNAMVRDGKKWQENIA